MIRTEDLTRFKIVFIPNRNNPTNDFLLGLDLIQTTSNLVTKNHSQQWPCGNHFNSRLLRRSKGKPRYEFIALLLTHTLADTATDLKCVSFCVRRVLPLFIYKRIRLCVGARSRRLSSLVLVILFYGHFSLDTDRVWHWLNIDSHRCCLFTYVRCYTNLVIQIQNTCRCNILSSKHIKISVQNKSSDLCKWTLNSAIESSEINRKCAVLNRNLFRSRAYHSRCWTKRRIERIVHNK